MLILTDNCSTILDVKDAYVVIRLLRRYYSVKDANLVFALFNNRSNFIYYQHSDFNTIKNAFEISAKTKAGMIKKLKEFDSDIYFLLDLDGASNDYCYEIVHHSEVVLSGQAAIFLRKKLIDNLIKEL